MCVIFIVDRETTPEELEEQFGKQVRKYVLEVTDDKVLLKNERKEKQIEHAETLSKGAVLIKLGDKISNVTDIIYNPPSKWDINRRKAYLDWAEKVISNCPQVNEKMESKFQEVLSAGRESSI